MTNTHKPLTSAATVTAVCSLATYIAYNSYRKRRSQWQAAEEHDHGGEALYSVLSHFKSLSLDPHCTVEEANKLRTVSYYEKAREAHVQELVLGIGNYSALLKKRRDEMDRILKRANDGTKSHRTVISMCDSTTVALLSQARDLILTPLQYSTDMRTRGVWIPELNIIPPNDMHVTVAVPWWWHTIRLPLEENEELSRQLVARFRQTLLLEFHYAFQIELERIVLLGGKTLVALWRCVGHRTNEDGTITYDRHGDSMDPFVRLREEIVRCFTTESPDSRRQPLTYGHRKMEENINTKGKSLLKEPVMPPPPGLGERQHTIEAKTPGLGSGDGFIHTTLCRIPLECLSMHDVELTKVHRLCREATATLCGHRMVVSKFRFLETTGRGGESNPCVDPLFDETIEAPKEVSVEIDGAVNERTNLHVPTNIESHQTIGAVRNFMRPPTESVATLFDAPMEEEKDNGSS